MPVPLPVSISPDVNGSPGRPLPAAIVQTVAYVDVFDYPLLPAEVHRYLVGLSAPLEAVDKLLSNGALVPHHLERCDGYVTLPGRRQIVETRRLREANARQLWPLARYYGALIAQLPFVRMVAVTGSLAVNNAEPGADIDYLIVTANGRLWLSRAFVILVVRLAATRGVRLCPNYLLAERALVFPEQTLYAAHELAQMVPLSGYDVYRQMRGLNGWVNEWLPNATNSPTAPVALADSLVGRPARLQRLLERALESRLGQRLEQWEMERKLARFSGQAAQGAPGPGTMEAHFAADWCKGHFDGHARQIMQAYGERIQALGAEP